MIKKAAIVILLLSIFTLANAHSSFAQTDKNTEKIKVQVKKIIAGEKVTKKVKLHNGTVYKGFLGSATDDSFVVQDKTGGFTL
jgi:hypothetical protein